MNWFFIIIGLILILYIFSIVIKGKFSIVESIFWLLGSLIILVFSVFPQIIIVMANILNIKYPPSLLFLLVSVFLIFVNFRNTQRIEKQNEMIIYLGQELAILKEKNK